MKIDNFYEWSTHRPLLQALVFAFNPKFILELGMGLFSSPIFIDYNPEELVFIENDEEWIKHMKEKFGSSYNIILHKLDDSVLLGTHPYQLTSNQRDAISGYYKDLSKLLQSKDMHPRFLFVDNFTCCRNFAINILYSVFDIVAYHDCQPAGIPWYEYSFEENLRKEFNHYTLKTPTSWTGVFIRRSLDQSRLGEIIIPYINQYCNENKLNDRQIYLEKQY
jgi:hypothetical protein